MLSKFSLGNCTRHAGLTADPNQELTWWRSMATELRDVRGGCLCPVPDTIACGVFRNTCMGPVIYKHGQAPPISKRSEGMIWTTTCIPNNDLWKREDTEECEQMWHIEGNRKGPKKIKTIGLFFFDDRIFKTS